MDSSEYVQFNINYHVFVQLTPTGIEHWKNEFLKFAPPNYSFQQHYDAYTKDGWTSFQLHALMETFGDILTQGFGSLPFGTNIRFKSNEFQKVED